MSLLRRLGKESESELTAEAAPDVEEEAANGNGSDRKQEERRKLIAELQTQVLSRAVEELADEVEEAAAANGNRRAHLTPHVNNVLTEVLNEAEEYLPRRERDQIVSAVLDEVIGFGPINPLLEDPEITEIMVNGPRQVYVERGGRIQHVEVTFRDDAHVLHTIEKIITPLGRRLDESSPMVDARLPDGSRVNAIIPPLAIKGPTITIRKFSADPYGVDDLIRFGTLSAEIASFLNACVQGRLNILISGGTGAGKTTTLNVLSSFIPSDERIVTIENAAELQLHQEHVVTLETRPVNIEGRGEVTIRDLVINSLRMRPDRIVVGEVRGGEALDMLQAMNTGHDGSITTGHANSPRDVLSRLETMVLMAGMDLPVRAIREQIAAAIHLIVQQRRFPDGSRKIVRVTEVAGMEGDNITLQDIFVFRQEGRGSKGAIMGRHAPTGIVPGFMDHLKQNGVNLSQDAFRPFPGGGPAAEMSRAHGGGQ